MILILTAVLHGEQDKPAFPGSHSKTGERKQKTKKATENQSLAIRQTNHSTTPHSSFPKERSPGHHDS